MLFITITFLNTVVSSANFSTLLVISSSKSLKYIKNNKGPNTDPHSKLISSCCLLSASHFSIQSIMPSPIPWGFNRNLWFDVFLLYHTHNNILTFAASFDVENSVPLPTPRKELCTTSNPSERQQRHCCADVC